MAADSFLRGVGASQNWYLRLGDGGVFGPVSISTLVEWAKQGRVLAANEVSNDNANWRPASSVEELGMTWYVETPGGAIHGPFNRAAADLLARDGRLGEGSKVVAAADADLSRLHNPQAAKKPGGDDSQGELALGSGSRENSEDIQSLREDRESLRLQVRDLEEKLRQMIRTAEKDTKSQERQKEQLRKTIAELEREREDLRQAIDAQEPAAVQSNSIDEALDEERRRFADEKAMAEREADALRARIAELESAVANAKASSEEADALRSRIVELEAAVATAKAAGDEAEALRARIAEIEAAGEEATALRSRVAELEADVASAKAAGDEAEALRARIAELEAVVATAKASGDEAEALRSRIAELEAAGDEANALRSRIAELEADVAAAKASGEEANGLRARIAELEAAVATAKASGDDAEALRARIAELEATGEEANALRSRISELEASGDEANALRSRIVELETAIASTKANGEEADALRSRISELESKLDDSRREFAELLAASNERDAEYQRKIGEAPSAPPDAQRQGQLAHSGRLPVEVAESIDVIERVLEAENDDFNSYRDATVKRQNLLRERLQALRALQESPEEGGHAPATGSPRSLEAARLRDELEGLRLLHQRTVRQAEERERELSRRVRTLESDDARMRARLGEADDTNHRLRELSDTLRQRELELEQERYLRKVEQDQSQQTQADMAKRIDDLERRLNTNADIEVHPEADMPHQPQAGAPAEQAQGEAVATPQPSPRRHGFSLPPWMQLRR